MQATCPRSLASERQSLDSGAGCLVAEAEPLPWKVSKSDYLDQAPVCHLPLCDLEKGFPVPQFPSPPWKGNIDCTKLIGSCEW